MSHPIYKVRSAKIVATYTLQVGFDDGTERVIDFRPVLASELYGPLRALDQFNQVRIDPEVHTLVWPNGSGFDLATLHDWPEQEKALTARARAEIAAGLTTPTQSSPGGLLVRSNTRQLFSSSAFMRFAFAFLVRLGEFHIMLSERKIMPHLGAIVAAALLVCGCGGGYTTKLKVKSNQLRDGMTREQVIKLFEEFEVLRATNYPSPIARTWFPCSERDHVEKVFSTNQTAFWII